jgi:hypothetical protein
MLYLDAPSAEPAALSNSVYDLESRFDSIFCPVNRAVSRVFSFFFTFPNDPLMTRDVNRDRQP